MTPRHPALLVPLLCPGLRADGEILPQQWDYSYQLYQEDDNRIRVESHYIRGNIELNDETSIRFQWLNDAITGSSPTGILPGSAQPSLASVEDIRTGILGALSRQFGDHRVEVEVSHSREDDYISRGFTLSDAWNLNQKNTTISMGFNYLNDSVLDSVGHFQDKDSYDLFAGVSQIIDKNTVITANLTMGYAQGYLNDPYKLVQRTDIVSIPDGLGGTIQIPVVNIYGENRPDSRFRQVLQFEGSHYFEKASGALDATLRFSHDDYGILSETAEIEWRQEIGASLIAIPFVRYYHQNAADFFVNSLDGVVAGTPTGSGKPYYSADYRLSSFDAVSAGLRLKYQINDHFSATAAYERYIMNGVGGSSDQSPGFAYPSADIWTIGLSASF